MKTKPGSRPSRLLVARPRGERGAVCASTRTCVLISGPGHLPVEKRLHYFSAISAREETGSPRS